MKSGGADNAWGNVLYLSRVMCWGIILLLSIVLRYHALRLDLS